MFCSVDIPNQNLFAILHQKASSFWNLLMILWLSLAQSAFSLSLLSKGINK